MSSAGLEDLGIAAGLIIAGGLLVKVVGNRIIWAPIAGGAAIAIGAVVLFCALIAP
jgi:hypothetical protein